MIIGTCSFGSTGSSAVSDFLAEYDDLQVMDKLEFTWISRVDGLIDLERAVMHPHYRSFDSAEAIDRFLKNVQSTKKYFATKGYAPEAFERSAADFIDAITQCSWYDYPSEYSAESAPVRYVKKKMKYKVIPKIEQRKQERINCWPMVQKHLSVCPGNFYEAAKKHVGEVLTGLGADLSKTIVLDQVFPGNDPQACFPFFDDPRAIVVDRDPRDNYVFSRTKLLGRNHYMALDTVEDFIAYYKALRDGQPYKAPDPRIQRVQFEDLVYDYDNTTKTIREFLGLGENPNPKKIFDPAISMPNTQVFKRYPRFADDVKKIEEALAEYLFDFGKYPDADTSGEMFFGKSPKNTVENRKNG